MLREDLLGNRQVLPGSVTVFFDDSEQFPIFDRLIRRIGKESGE